MEKGKILIVDDSADILEIVSLYLINAGYHVTVANDYSKALQAIEKQLFDLILLDILLPDSTGYELCKKVRESIYCPIIFLSCLNSEESITKALELGGDDFIAKPARPKEIIARVNAHLRRVKQYAKQQQNLNTSIEIGGLILDTNRQTVSSAKLSVSLTPLELSILIFLLQRIGQMVSYNELLENVWKTKAFDDHRTVKVHVSNLKKKLKKVNSTQNLIANIRGKGYMLMK